MISLRTHVAANFFPRVYCIYFSLFLLYFCHFPCGWCSLALKATTLLTIHAMLYCYNTLEIPAVEVGVVSAITPREGHNVLEELLVPSSASASASAATAASAAAVAAAAAAATTNIFELQVKY